MELRSDDGFQCFFRLFEKKKKKKSLPLSLGPSFLAHSEASSLARRELRQLLDALCPSGHGAREEREQKTADSSSSALEREREREEEKRPSTSAHALPAAKKRERNFASVSLSPYSLSSIHKNPVTYTNSPACTSSPANAAAP